MMSRFLLILIAFSILNQSIDLDYLTFAATAPQARPLGYDDFDTITEYVIEQFMDDDTHFPEHDDDSNGMPHNKGVEKFSWNPMCCQWFQKPAITPTNKTDKASQRARQQVHPTCKGYSNIVCPPPDAWVA